MGQASDDGLRRFMGEPAVRRDTEPREVEHVRSDRSLAARLVSVSPRGHCEGRAMLSSRVVLHDGCGRTARCLPVIHKRTQGGLVRARTVLL
jgi:hypothetical protein